MQFTVWIDSMKDLWRIQKAAFSSRRYSITINNEFAGDFWNSFKTRIVYKFLPTLLSSIKLLHRLGATPVFITVTDISPGAPLYTDPVPALRCLLFLSVLFRFGYLDLIFCFHHFFSFFIIIVPFPQVPDKDERRSGLHLAHPSHHH